MNLNRMKKSILLLLLVIPTLTKAQNVMTETRRELTSPDGAYRFTFYQRSFGEDNARMYYTLIYKNRPVVEEGELGVQIENQLFESALGVPNDTCHFWCENLKLTDTDHRKNDATWKPVYGERAEVRDCYNEMTLKFRKGEGQGMTEGGYDKRKNYFISDLLSSGRSCRLVQHLVQEKQVFNSIDAYISGSIDEGLFHITGKPAPGVTLEAAEAAVWQELKALTEESVDEDELEKVKNRYESEQIFNNLNYLNVATNLAYFELTGKAEDINNEVNKYRSVTAGQIKEAAQKTFVRENCSTLYYKSNLPT